MDAVQYKNESAHLQFLLVSFFVLNFFGFLALVAACAIHSATGFRAGLFVVSYVACVTTSYQGTKAGQGLRDLRGQKSDGTPRGGSSGVPSTTAVNDVRSDRDKWARLRSGFVIFTVFAVFGLICLLGACDSRLSTGTRTMLFLLGYFLSAFTVGLMVKSVTMMRDLKRAK